MYESNTLLLVYLSRIKEALLNTKAPKCACKLISELIVSMNQQVLQAKPLEEYK